MSELRLFTSESVTEGHPDKICDQISDTILDALLEIDPSARVAVETMVTTGLVHVAGEISTEDAYVDIPTLIRKRVNDIGYTSSEIGFDGNSCGVSVSIGEQSPDIAQGVNSGFEVREGASQDDLDSQGAGDQGIMFGYASNETPTLMPAAISIAHLLSSKLAEVRKTGVFDYLRPDGKTQVTLGFEGSVPKTVETIVLSTQHHPSVSTDQLRSDMKSFVIEPVLEGTGLNFESYKALINPTGRFEIGGPMGDAGLTGRKIIVDTYGGAARHGGGAFSGKDPSKVDRSAAYAMRWVAKNIVAAGFADRAEVQVAYAIGKANPVGLYVETFGTEKFSIDKIRDAVLEVFDLRPKAIIRDLDLLRPIYAQTAAYGHFGRELPDFSWERKDRVIELQKALGI
jgi:S-adenosylmethionine synthetase